MKTFSLCLGLALVAVLLFLGFSAGGRDIPGVGQTGRIYCDGCNLVPFGNSAADYQAFVETPFADKFGIAELIEADRIFMAANGVPVLVLDIDFSKTKVRILSGDHVGRAGWISIDFLVR